jgi:hypothetical protein
MDLIDGSDISISYLSEDRDRLASASGKLVSLSATGTANISFSEHPYESTLLGVVANSSRVNLGVDGERSVRVATGGRTPVYVTNENGPIKVGDPITSSSIEGIGMKADRPGHIIGRAAQAFDPSSGQGSCGYVDISGVTCQGQIFVQLEPSYSLNAQNFTDTAISTLDSAMGYLTSTTNVTFGDLGSIVIGQITAKVAIVQNFFADKIFANRVQTKELCVEDVCVTKAQFLNMVQAASAGAATGGSSGGSGSSDSAGGNSDATTTPDTEAPVITVNGASPALINVGDTYSDLGATALDNGTYTLPVTASLDGGPQIDSSAIQLDTTAAGEHTVTYSSTDAAGNVSTATRTVIINQPTLP